MRLVAWGLSLALVVTLTDVPVSPARASAEPVQEAPAQAQCPDGRPDRVSAAVTARLCGRRVEVTGELSETTQVWVEPDGSMSAQVYAGPVRLRGADGQWLPVDLTLQRLPDGSVAARGHPRGLRLAGGSGDGEHDLAVLGSGREQVVLGWRGRLPQPVLAGTRATYPQVWPGVDLVVQATRTGFEQSLVVQDRAALARLVSVRMPWRTVGLSVRSAGGGLVLRDASGADVARVPAAMVWDATVDAASGEHPRRGAVTMRLAADPGGGTEIVLTPDPRFLADPGLVFPVTLDPGGNFGVSYDAFVQTDYGSNQEGATELKLGTYNGGGVKARSLFRFDASPFYGAVISSATLNLWEFHSYSCRAAEWELWQTGWPDYATVWSNQPAWLTRYGTSSATRGYSSSCGDGWVSIPATGWLQAFANSRYQYSAFGLRAKYENDSDSWKKFNSAEAASNIPYLAVSWDTMPVIGARSTSPTTPCAVGSGRPYMTSKTPRLSAVVSEAGGQASNLLFEWWPVGGSAALGSATAAGVPSGTTGSVTIPGSGSSALAEGGTYSWRVRATDTGGQSSPWSSWCEFTVDTIRPGVPLVSSTDYPGDGTWHGRYGQAGQFTFTPASGTTDLAAFEYQLDTATTTTTVNATGATTVSITPPEDGTRTLQVWAKDRAGNLSDAKVYTFKVGRAGLSQPGEGANVVRRMKLAIDGDSYYTRVRFQYRRGPGAVEHDVPLANLQTAAGGPVTAALVPLADLGGYAVWNATDTLGLVGGVVQVRGYLFPAADNEPGYQTQWVTVTVDPSGDGGATETVGPGSVNLLTGGHSLGSTDVDEFGLSASRVAVSRKPTDGWLPQGERLTADQQQVGPTASYASLGMATLTRVTTLGQGGTTDSLRIDPNGTSSESLAYVGGDYMGGLNGMTAGRRYRASGWVYVPAQTGLAPDHKTRGLRIVAFYQVGGVYYEIPSASASYADAWQYLQVDLAVPAGATGAFFRFYNGFQASGKVVYWDNLSIREVVAPFGPQWRGGVADGPAGSDYTSLEFPTPDVAKLNTADGSWVTFGRSIAGGFFPEPGAEALTLSNVDASTYRLTDVDGTVVEFKRQTGSTAFVVTSTWTAEADSTTRYVYDLTDNRTLVKRVINPVEPGVGDCTTAVPARGCEVLEYDYAAATTATATALGDVKDQVRAVKAWSWDPVAGAMNAVEVARYGYDSQGRLREVWDPRLATPLKTRYDYDAAGRVTKVTPAGELPWMFDYGAADVDASALRWDLDEGQNPVAGDASGNGRNGTFAGGAGWGRGNDYTNDGDSAATFTGVNGQQVAASGPAVDTSRSFTVSAWAKLTSVGAFNRAVVSQDGSRTSGFILHYVQALNRWSFSMLSADSDSATSIRAVSSAAPTLGVWTHLTGAYDASAGQMRLYVNGVLQGTTARSGAWNATGSFVAGRAKWAGSTYNNLWVGSVDDVRAYPKALSAAQIAILAGDEHPGRLHRVRRAALAQGSKNVTDGENATRIVYNVPLTRTAGGPHDLNAATAGRWGQQDVPTDGIAIFPPEQDPLVVNASAAMPGPDGYRLATGHYLNASGQRVNTATPGGYIDTQQYDSFGNVVWTLEATNRMIALGTHPQAGEYAAQLNLPPGSADRAALLAKTEVYSADGIDLKETVVPVTLTALESDLADPTGARPTIPAGSTVVGRGHTAFTYDEGKPDGADYHLVTNETSGLKVDGYPADADVRVKKYGYGGEKGGTSGWQVKKPTKEISDAGVGGLALTTYSVYDPAGRPTQLWGIDTAGTDARTVKMIFYTAGTNTVDAACGSRPEWAGQPCVTKAAGAVTGHDPARMPTDLPMRRITRYSRWGEAEVTTETAAGKTRTTTTTYDRAGRVANVQIMSDDDSTQLPAVTTAYDPASGQAVQTSMGSARIIREYDLLGREYRYTDADGGVTTNEFDRFGKPVKVVDNTGWQTFAYDLSVEPRGLLTSVTDSVAGTFHARYSPDGQLVEVKYPGGLTRRDTLDASFTPLARVYTRNADGQTIYAESVVENTAGQWITHSYNGGSKTYGYDRIGRVSSVKQVDSLEQCTTRLYGYTSRTNRMSKRTFHPAADGSCRLDGMADAEERHSYDSADRLVDTGYSYDAFGRTRTTPDGMQIGYHVNELVASQQQGDARQTWTLDPEYRFRAYTTGTLVDGAWVNASSRLNHYSDDSDTPRWIIEDTTTGSITRNVPGPDTDLAATTSASGDVRLLLTNLHGDVAITVDTALTTFESHIFDEFGIPATDQASQRYGWLGGKQRSSEAAGDVILMGVRLYSPSLGRFLQVDPIYGGSANPYEYAYQDPCNKTDLTGGWATSWMTRRAIWTRACGHIWKRLGAKSSRMYAATPWKYTPWIPSVLGGPWGWIVQALDDIPKTYVIEGRWFRLRARYESWTDCVVVGSYSTWRGTNLTIALYSRRRTIVMMQGRTRVRIRFTPIRFYVYTGWATGRETNRRHFLGYVRIWA